MSIVAFIKHFAIENIETVSGGQDLRRRNELKTHPEFFV
jgi:hypothetical protein